MNKHLGLFLAVVGFNLLGGFGIAHADPVTAAITTILTTVGVSASIASAIASFTVALLKNVGMSLLGQALSKKPKIQNAGIKTQTSTGGSVSQTFILGQRATAGQLVTPLMTYGTAGKTENAYLVYVIALGCIPGQTISRVILNDEYVELATTETQIGGTGPDASAPGRTASYGLALGGAEYAGHAWLRYHAGDQTEVDPFLDKMLRSYPERPWTTSMIGKGMCYAVVVFKYNREILNAPPSIRFELNGIPLYDPRLDETVGGSGPHRWGQPATWKDKVELDKFNQTTNPAVMMYNLHRGIVLPDGSIYGGEAAAEDLPVANWMAAMNACDQDITLSSGGTEKRFTAGLEVSLSDEPADVFEALETACQAQQVEIGGVWKVRVGGPGAPVAFITDDDILIDHDRNHDMFPGLNETHNGIQASHPLPSALWEMTDAPVRYNRDLEEEDDGRRLIADLTLPAVFSPTQAQRLMTSYIEEERRFRRHYLTLGPYASMLEPLDAIAWYSVSEGYTETHEQTGAKIGKLFEVTTVNEGLRTLNVELGLRERHSDDFNWTPGQALPWPVGTPGMQPQVIQKVPVFSVRAESLKDATNKSRRPGILIIWDGADMPDVRGLMWEVRVRVKPAPPTYEVVNAGSIQDITADSVLLVDGILPNTRYDVRARIIAERPTEWTAWEPVTTDDIRLDLADLVENLATAIETPLDEVLRTNLQLQSYQQIQDALNYTGDGRSLQFATLQAINQGQDAIDTVDLIGVMAGDRSAFRLDTDFVKVVVPNAVTGADEVKALSGFIDTTVSRLGDNQSAIEQKGLAIDGLTARYSLKVQTLGPSGPKAVAGMVFDVDEEVGTIGFFANRFFIASPSTTAASDDYKTPFFYDDATDELLLNSDVKVEGDLVVNGTITTEKLIENAVTSFVDGDFLATYDVGPAKDWVGGIVDGQRRGTELKRLSFNPNGGRVRISFRITFDNPHDNRCAARIKLWRGNDRIGQFMSILDNAMSTTISSYIYDKPGPGKPLDTEQEYWISAQTITGINVGDNGGSPYDADVGSGNLTVESIRR